jgi:hypothetical protein
MVKVSTWFANARRRLKKENKMTWEPRNKCNESVEETVDESSCSESEFGDTVKSDVAKGLTSDETAAQVEGQTNVTHNSGTLSQNSFNSSANGSSNASSAFGTSSLPFFAFQLITANRQ